MLTIEQRCASSREFTAFVTPETVDLLGRRMIGVVGDRRITMVCRYVGDAASTPTVITGLRVRPNGINAPTMILPGRSTSIALGNSRHMSERVGIVIGLDDETEAQQAHRYHHPEEQFLQQRRNIMRVVLEGFPGSPCADDSIRIERWNENGVGKETIIAFDDINLVEELAWDIKGDAERRVHLDNGWCVHHSCHHEDPAHTYGGACYDRDATLAENLAVLSTLAKQNEGK